MPKGLIIVESPAKARQSRECSAENTELKLQWGISGSPKSKLGWM